MQLIIKNTLEEIIEVKHTAQLARLSSSVGNRRILTILVCRAVEEERSQSLTKKQRANIMVAPFPHNVQPQYNANRRKATCEALLKSVRANPESACFLDALQYG
ncbi:hypothetical protein HPB51_027832 [Rhipicephalus microplus]|uniref:Uncharacterized protein n=1 Tax=Rhipicephalus microplus TaxID=6941 RepID=A0A9J6CZ73_RHIMP|nr:hypothetical protein HPB51_027832 [Rhipicephalus microplus]